MVFVKKILLGFILLVGLGVLLLWPSTPPVIRLHILAHSNSEIDQALKYRVRDEIICLLQKELGDLQDLGEAREIVVNQLPNLMTKARECVAQEGFNYSVDAFYGWFHFPKKSYDSIFLPAGRYEALRLVLGEGRGENWWCMLFPPLCFVNGEQSLCLEIEEKAGLEEIQIKPALKIVEVFKDVLNK